MSIDADSLEEHPLLVKLLQEGNPDTMPFWGNVGPSEHDGSIALYPSLENIGSAIEIPKGDILHVENVQYARQDPALRLPQSLRDLQGLQQRVHLRLPDHITAGVRELP